MYFIAAIVVYLWRMVIMFVARQSLCRSNCYWYLRTFHPPRSFYVSRIMFPSAIDSQRNIMITADMLLSVRTGYGHLHY